MNLFASIIYSVEMKGFIWTFHVYFDISVICHLQYHNLIQKFL